MSKEVIIKHLMGEEEIIKYLQINRYVGTVFGLMPADVRSWLNDHSRSEYICVYGEPFGWLHRSHPGHGEFNYSVAYCIDEDYKPVQNTIQIDSQILQILKRIRNFCADNPKCTECPYTNSNGCIFAPGCYPSDWRFEKEKNND